MEKRLVGQEYQDVWIFVLLGHAKIQAIKQVIDSNIHTLILFLSCAFLDEKLLPN